MIVTLWPADRERPANELHESGTLLVSQFVHNCKDDISTGKVLGSRIILEYDNALLINKLELFLFNNALSTAYVM
jgi:hypothetical protein